MRLKQHQVKEIKRVVRNKIEQALRHAFLGEKQGKSLKRAEAICNDYLKKNEALKSFINSLQDVFIYSSLEFGQIKTSIEGCFKDFDALIPDYVADMASAYDGSVRDLEHALSSIAISNDEHQQGVGFAFEAIREQKEYLKHGNVRKISSDKRLMRRMDSFARLLALNTDISACTAVSVHGGQLYIAANVSGDVPQAEMARMFKGKLEVLRTFIKDLNTDEGLITVESSMLKPMIEECITKLIDIGGSPFNVLLLEQALFKLVDALQPRVENPLQPSMNGFSEAERSAILDSENQTTLLMQKGRYNKSKNKLFIEAYETAKASSDGQRYKMPMPMELQDRNLKDFHAEQLIAYYLQNEKHVDLKDTEKAEIRIGVSKLCCATCYDALKHFERVELRGTHGIRYAYVADIFSNTSVNPNSTPQQQKKPITFANPSPGDTPFDRPTPFPDTSTLKDEDHTEEFGPLVMPEIETNCHKRKKPKKSGSAKASVSFGSPNGVGNSWGIFSPKKLGQPEQEEGEDIGVNMML